MTKENNKELQALQEELKKKLEEWKDVFLKDDGEEDNIQKGNALMEEISQKLPYKSNEEKERWLDYGATFKDFDDFYNFTIAIIEKRDYFTINEREELECDSDGYEVDGFDRFHHCDWCGDVDVDGHRTDLGWLCDHCIQYFATCHSIQVYYGYDED